MMKNTFLVIFVIARSVATWQSQPFFMRLPRSLRSLAMTFFFMRFIQGGLDESSPYIYLTLLHQFWLRDAHERECALEYFFDVIDGQDANAFYLFFFLSQDGIKVIVGIKLLTEVKREFGQVREFQRTNGMENFFFKL